VSRKVGKGEVLYERCGTPAYIAPEILKGYGYEGPPVDVWSAGVVLYAILYGTFPFNGDTVEELELAIQKGDYTLPEEISSEARDLLANILNSDPATRIKLPEIYSHSWMSSVNKSCIFSLNKIVCLFSEEEIDRIRKDYNFKERQKDLSVSDDNSIFTVHNLDTENNEEEELSRSIVMAPYNTNESDEENFVETIESLILNKRTIKFSSKLREINREYERDNNSKIDNGIYLKSTNAIISSKTYYKKDSIPRTNQINKRVLDKMEEMGFDRKFVIGSINASSHNNATTCYYLLSEK